MSLKSSFHTTENLLIERAQLHGLVDFFWLHLPYTRDEIYKKLSTILCIKDAHISDLSSEQIKQIAERFQSDLNSIAPCSSCAYKRQTSYGLCLCGHEKGHGAYWSNPANEIPERCSLYVQEHIPAEK